MAFFDTLKNAVLLMLIPCEVVFAVVIGELAFMILLQIFDELADRFRRRRRERSRRL